ncbi:MAG: response regulator [Desulfobacteraceae bacterium]|nr:response regulator [Desulfobacteraceae bacterium]
MNNSTKIISSIQRILIVDDESSLRSLLTKALSRVGYICDQAHDAPTALEMIKSCENSPFDLVISDISMPGMDGIALLKTVKSLFQGIDFIIMTGYASNYSYVDIMDAGASDYMIKPLNISSTLARISRIAREKTTLINLKQTNLQLCAAIERANKLAMVAKEASRAKTFFLASMSHEIRTPLNGIVGYTDMLMDTPLNTEQSLFLKNAKTSCDTLLSVVNDILDFSKVESGKLSLESIEFDPEVVCFDTIDVVRPQVDELKIELGCRISDIVPGMVKGDPHRFRQVLLNLLGNAVKFTRAGSITLALDAKKINSEMVKLLVSVTDTGIGISSVELDTIFKPFVQSEEDITNRHSGTGLGLAISKKIARRMDGDLWVESQKSKGSVFYFTACMTRGKIKKHDRVKLVGLKGKRVLVSTTTLDAFDLLNHELLRAGMLVHYEPWDNLPLFLTTPPGQNFDMGIIDFGKLIKPISCDLSGILEKIAPPESAFEWIVCAAPFPGIAKVFKRAGFKGFLSKPFRKQILWEMSAYVMGMAKIPDQGSCQESDELLTVHSLAENQKYGVSILLVEDNPVNQKMTCMMLSKAGYTVEVAGDGKQALELFKNTQDGYDLILMDINMPKMDGVEATRQIRSYELKFKPGTRVPILALTANVLDDFKQKCLGAGMDDFLTKPIKRDLVFKALKNWSHPKD